MFPTFCTGLANYTSMSRIRVAVPRVYESLSWFGMPPLPWRRRRPNFSMQEGIDFNISKKYIVVLHIDRKRRGQVIRSWGPFGVIPQALWLGRSKYHRVQNPRREPSKKDIDFFHCLCRSTAPPSTGRHQTVSFSERKSEKGG